MPLSQNFNLMTLLDRILFEYNTQLCSDAISDYHLKQTIEFSFVERKLNIETKFSIWLILRNTSCDPFGLLPLKCGDDVISLHNESRGFGYKTYISL